MYRNYVHYVSTKNADTSRYTQFNILTISNFMKGKNDCKNVNNLEIVQAVLNPQNESHYIPPARDA